MKTEDHNRIIEIAFGPKSDGPRLSDRDRAILKDASRDVDSIWWGQTRARSYQHAMRGEGQPVAEAQALSRAFARYNLQLAADLQRGGSHARALYQLGKGMHTIADSFSPDHEALSLGAGIFFLRSGARKATPSTPLLNARAT